MKNSIALAALFIVPSVALAQFGPGLTGIAQTYGANNGPNHSFNQTNNPTAGMSDSFTAARSSYSFGLGYTCLFANAAGTYVDQNHYGEGFVNLFSIDPIVANLAGGGAGGQLRITYQVSANVQPGNNPLAYYPTASVTFPSTFGYSFSAVNGNANSSLTHIDTVNFSSGQVTNLSTNAVSNTLLNTVGAQGAPSGSASINVTRSRIEVWANGAPAEATTSGYGGSTFTKPVPASGSYATTLTNTGLGSLGTTVTLGGTASAATTCYGAFKDFPLGVNACSDLLSLEGTNSDLHLVSMSYDAALAFSVAGSDQNVLLGTIDPNGLPRNAVLFNSDGGANSHFFMGSPSLGILGDYGVDIATHTAWAWLDHNSDYVVYGTTSVPEPSSLILLGTPLLMVRIFRRKNRSAITAN